MKGNIFDIKHFAVHDGPGIRQTIFLKGCPLNCWWCHNPESQNKNPEKFVRTNKIGIKEFKKEITVGYQTSADDLLKIIIGDRVFFEESGGGVTFSGGEPLMQGDFLLNILKLCKEQGIHTCVDTSGFGTKKIIETIAEETDLFLFDLKIMDSSLYKKYTGVPIEGIIENLKWLDEINENVILRFPVIPGITNTRENITEIKSFIQTLKNINQIDLLPYHNISNGKYARFNKKNKMGNIKPLSNKDMDLLKTEFEEIGFEVGIGG